MDYSRITLETRGGVAVLTLDRPATANALDRCVAIEIQDALGHVRESQDARVLLIKGAGARFCGGGDLKAMLAAGDRLAYVRALATELDQTFQDLSDLQIPVVAAVHGSVAGAGLALMLSCDIVIAASDTTFVAAYPDVALTPDCGLSWLLPRAIGQQRARVRTS